MGGRFPVLDQCAHGFVAGGDIHDSVVRTYKVTESEWSGPVLLAVFAYCMVGEATVLDQPADICFPSTLLRGILCRIRSCVGRICT